MDLRDMPKLSLRFEAPFPEPHLAITFNPPFPDINPIFRAVANARLRPFSIAIECNAVSEETALKMYAQTYAEGSIDRSDTPGFESLTIDQWTAWLIEHPDHFQEIRELVDHRPNWNLPVEEDDGLASHLGS